MTKLECQNVSFSWSSDNNGAVEALRDVSLHANDGEIVGLIGPSGSGKSTLLRIIAGLEIAAAGKALVDGKVISRASRELGMVFQDPLLFPWLNVRKNVAFGYRMRRVAGVARRESANEMLGKVGLSKWGDRHPHELSGGMKQRVAIARALMNDPEVLLMDEPFAALDFQTRLLMGQFLLDVWTQFEKTIVFVTHSIDEAILLSDRVLVMSSSPGTIKKEVHIPLDRPRDSTSAECNDFRLQLTRYIEQEVKQSFT